MRDNQIAQLVQQHELDGQTNPLLLQLMERHIRHLAGRYPNAYFELGQRDEAALASLSNRVFTTCDRVTKGRFPFQDRTPFRAYVEEEFGDPPIRQHTFYARLSVTRELMRSDYAHNLVRDPELRRRDTLYRELGEVLPRIAQSIPQGKRPPLWQISTGPSRVRAPEAVIEQLRRAGATSMSLEALAREALVLLGQSISRSRLSHLLAEILPAAAPAQQPAAEAPDLTETMAVRGAILRAWQGLSDLDHALVIGLARGDDADTILTANPQLKHRVAVSRAINRVGRCFVAEVVAELGGQPSPSLTPRALMDRILAVLINLLPELEASRA